MKFVDYASEAIHLFGPQKFLFFGWSIFESWVTFLLTTSFNIFNTFEKFGFRFLCLESMKPILLMEAKALVY